MAKRSTKPKRMSIPEKIFMKWVDDRLGHPYKSRNSNHNMMRDAFLTGFKVANTDYEEVYEKGREEGYEEGYNKAISELFNE